MPGCRCSDHGCGSPQAPGKTGSNGKLPMAREHKVSVPLLGSDVGPEKVELDVLLRHQRRPPRLRFLLPLGGVTPGIGNALFYQ
ncbi:hypothetical protein D1007_33582 [Hordeum vulgare]|nr:hypothetical protein D1007_33582 [Hordeum vulgare]